MTHKRVVAVVFSIWIISAVLSISQLWLLAEEKMNISVVLAIIFGFCFICTTFFNCRIYFTLRRHINQMRAQQAAQNDQAETIALAIENREKSRENLEKICSQFILHISCVYSLLLARVFQVSCEFNPPTNVQFHEGNLFVYLDHGVCSFLAESCYLLLEDAKHSTLHLGYTARYITKTELNKAAVTKERHD